jgi:hypothetical protein
MGDEDQVRKPQPESADPAATRECPSCHSTVPAVVFCGACGADLNAPAGRWQSLVRPRVYAAAPSQPVYLPRLTSSVFPRLAAPARRPFRTALITLLLIMVVMSVLQWQIPVTTISLLGATVLFGIYAWESNAFGDCGRILIIAIALGAALGVGWWWFTGQLLSSKHGVTAAAGQALQAAFANYGLVTTLLGGALIVLTTVLLRFLPAPELESLDGFVIGAAGALAHMSAASITWLVPQIVAGLISDATTTGDRMFNDAITYGVIDPLVTVALGGLVGAGLWFRPNPSRPHPQRDRAAILLCALGAAVLYSAVWVVESMEWERGIELAVNLVWAVLALLMLRMGLQIALLHENPDPATGDPVLCVRCERIVPDMAFCPVCGAAARASSRSSRQLRRRYRPVRQPAEALD